MKVAVQCDRLDRKCGNKYSVHHFDGTFDAGD